MPWQDIRIYIRDIEALSVCIRSSALLMAGAGAGRLSPSLELIVSVTTIDNRAVSTRHVNKVHYTIKETSLKKVNKLIITTHNAHNTPWLRSLFSNDDL